MLVCRVSFLDESEIKLTLNSNALGGTLLDKVFTYLNLVERDYFGLQIDCTKYKNAWVKPNKRIKQQFAEKSDETWAFKFLVKFYPSDPSFLKEELTKYHLCLQMREDLLTKRLPCPLDTLAILSSYWLQSEFGDDEMDSNDLKSCLSSLRSISDERAITDFDGQVLKQYRSRKGMPAVDADTQFLRLASKLPLYGVHRYTASDKRGGECIIGVNSSGIVEITSKHEAVTYKWNCIKHINYKKHKFYLKILSPASVGGHSTSKYYAFSSAIQAKALWQNAVDHHVFYRTTASDRTSIASTQGSPVIDHRNKLGKKRKLSFPLSFRKKRPNTEAETREESSKIQRLNPTVVRHSSLRRSASLKSNSSSPSTSETSQTKTKELKSILKNIPKVESSSQDEEDGRPYKSSDIEIVEPVTAIDILKPNLLLSETILEEDETTHSTEAVPDTENEIIKPMSCPVNELGVKAIVHEDSTSTTTKTTETTNLPQLIIEPVDETVAEETDYSKSNKTTSVSHLEPPPLVQQQTKDALNIPMHRQKLGNTELEDDLFDKKCTTQSQHQLLSEVTLEKHETELEARILDVDKEEKVLNNSTSITDVKSELTLTGEVIPSDYNKVDNYEEDVDDNKTIGGSSAVAIMGDDDVNFNDIIDDGDNINHYRGDNESSLDSFSSASCVSELTNDTEELCNPNIINIIWSKCLGSDDEMNDVYHKLFGVKLRRTKGRLDKKKARSNVFENPQQRSIGIQVPSPQENELNLNPNSRKFIPSWPFDPDSIASKSEIDELDQAAITAALQGHVEYTEIRSKIETKVDAKFTENVLLESDLKTHDFDFPEFAKSVSLYYLHSSTGESSRRISTSSTEETLPTATVTVEAMKYPMPIKRFRSSSDDEEDTTLQYTPREETSLQQQAVDANESGMQPTNTKENKEVFSAVDEVTDERCESNQSSGRSSPSLVSSASSTLSRSSFPRFIHSVFPLRMSKKSLGVKDRGRKRHRKGKKQDAPVDQDDTVVLKRDGAETQASAPCAKEKQEVTVEQINVAFSSDSDSQSSDTAGVYEVKNDSIVNEENESQETPV